MARKKRPGLTRVTRTVRGGSRTRTSAAMRRAGRLASAVRSYGPTAISVGIAVIGSRTSATQGRHGSAGPDQGEDDGPPTGGWLAGGCDPPGVVRLACACTYATSRLEPGATTPISETWSIGMSTSPARS